MIQSPVMTFSDWLNEKFLQFEKESGERKKLVDFARHLGMKQPSLSALLDGDYLPRERNFDILLDEYGIEFLEALGIKTEDPPELIELKKKYYSIPSENRGELLKFVDAFLQEHGYRLSDSDGSPHQ